MSDSASQPNYLELSLGSFLGLISNGEPAPAGGSVAAVAVALAAGLCVKSARLSASHLSDATDLVAAGEALRDRAIGLSQTDAEAYGQVVAALRHPRLPDQLGRQRAIAAALSHASDVPLEIAEIAAGVSVLAARLAESGNPNLRGDVVTAALLAESGARALTALIGINLEGVDDDERPARAAALLEETARNCARARRARPRE